MSNDVAVSVYRNCWMLLVLMGITIATGQQNAGSKEPLLRFPFIEFLADPCGVMPNSLYGDHTKKWISALANNPSKKPAINSDKPFLKLPLRKISLDGKPLSQEAMQFLSPFSEHYTNYKFTPEERKAFLEEFYLVLQEVKHRTNHMYPLSATNVCDSIQLESLLVNAPLESYMVPGKIDLKEIYRALAITAAHLHLMIRDISDSSRCFPIEKRSHRQNIRVLAGKVETLMCLSWAFVWTDSSFPSKGFPNFLEAVHDVLQMNMHRFYECSAREIRRCLVSRYAHRTFDAIQKLVNSELKLTFKN